MAMLVVIILAFAYVAYNQSEGYDELYEYKHEELNNNLKTADSLMLEINISFKALELERDSLLNEIDSLNVIRVELDSIRNVKIKKSNEKHNQINDANLSELSSIISGYIN